MNTFKSITFILLILTINNNSSKIKKLNSSSEQVNFAAILATNITLDTIRFFIDIFNTSVCKNTISSYAAYCPTGFTLFEDKCIRNCVNSNFTLDVLDYSCTYEKCDSGYRESPQGVCSSFTFPSYSMESKLQNYIFFLEKYWSMQ